MVEEHTPDDEVPEHKVSDHTYRMQWGMYNPNDVFDSERLAWKSTVEEKGFMVSELFSVPAGGTRNLHIKNDDNSGVTAFFTSVEVSTHFEGIARVYDSFSTAPSGGTSVDIDNLLMDRGGGTDPGNMTVNKNVSFTGSGTHTNAVFGGGSSRQMGSTGDIPLFGLEENREIVIQVENQSGAEDDAGITVAYFEHDELYSVDQ